LLHCNKNYCDAQLIFKFGGNGRVVESALCTGNTWFRALRAGGRRGLSAIAQRTRSYRRAAIDPIAQFFGSPAIGQNSMVEHKHTSGSPQSAEDREALREIARLIAERNEHVSPEAGDAGADQRGADRSADAGVAAAIRQTPEDTALRLLLDAVGVALAVCVGNELRYANAGFALAFGYRSVDELVAAGGLGRIFGTSASKLFEAGEGARDGDDRHEILLDGRTQSGRKVAMPIGLHRGGAGDNSVTLMVLRPAEDLPRQEQASDPQADILAKVSHEVRTPLNSIIGFAELIKQERFGPVGHAKYLGYAEDIYQSGQYALEIINDLLDLSKIKAGKLEINFTSVDINELVHECVHLIEPQARAERVVLRTSLEDPLWLVLADRRSLKQILLNLLSNALKFTEAGGQVIVSSLLGEAGSVVLRVRDTGIGMSQDDIVQAMKPFQQLETAPQQAVGTGLGLSLTKALVEANRASIHLQSAPGAGTCVDLVFPSPRVLKD